jgi:hypothetical protein
MAQLHRDPYPGDWEKHEKESWDAYDRRCEAMLESIRLKAEKRPDDQVVDGLLKFPVADGHAYYAVVSEKPLVLQHVPYGDGYCVSTSKIRGLRLQDVKFQLEAERELEKLFSKPSKKLKEATRGR